MKRRLFFSLLIGFIFVLLSLFYRTGSSNIEPMPYSSGCGNSNGNGNGSLCNGVTLLPPGGIMAPTGLAKRGLPLAVVSVNTDEDKPGNFYRNLNVVNAMIDVAVYSIIVFGVLTLLNKHQLKTKLK